MATAVEPSSAPQAPGKPLSLPVASLIGAIYVLAALAVVFYLVPSLWEQHVGSTETSTNMLLARLSVQVVALVGLIWFGTKLSGDAPPKGVRGGIFLMIAAAALIFLLARALAVGIEGSAGQIVGAVAGVALIYFAVRFFTGHTGERWMVALEEQGWFSLAGYKRSLGLRVRRLTVLGILIVGGTGAWSLWTQGVLPDTWTLSMPFDMQPLTVMTDAKIVIPLLLALLTLWVAFRAVNVPDFAEFLIATEAEMNKVSWSNRKRLMQDTVVVLLTTLIMTLFLLVVDLFWGWLLSRQTVGVLPGRSTSPDKAGQVKEAKW
jgi:preprotein translocase SecE subunit